MFTVSQVHRSLVALAAVLALEKGVYAEGLPDISMESNRALVCAHRATYGNVPENSLAAIKACISGGVDIIEVDVRKTKDGQLVLMHDATVDRTTNGSGQIKDMTWAIVRELSLREGEGKELTSEKVPTLEEVLELCKGNIYVNLDLKDVHLVKDCTTVIKKTGTESIIMYRSSNLDWLQYVEEKFPQMLLSPHFDHRRKNSNLDDKGENLNFLKPYFQTIDVWGIDIKDWDNPVLSKKNAAALKNLNIRVWVYTLWGKYNDQAALKNPAAVWGKLIDRGISVIMTDESDALIQYLKSIDRH